MNSVKCEKCGWSPGPPKGMGVHRPHIECPYCGGKIIIRKINDE